MRRRHGLKSGHALDFFEPIADGFCPLSYALFSCTSLRLIPMLPLITAVLLLRILPLITRTPHTFLYYVYRGTSPIRPPPPSRPYRRPIPRVLTGS